MGQEIAAEHPCSPHGRAYSLEAIILASRLGTAILCLPERGAMLCDELLPHTPNSFFVVEGWAMVRQEANRRGIYFVTYRGSSRALDCVCAPNTSALAKPARIEGIYAGLTRQRVSVPNPSHGEPALMTAFRKTRRRRTGLRPYRGGR